MNKRNITIIICAIFVVSIFLWVYTQRKNKLSDTESDYIIPWEKINFEDEFAIQSKETISDPIAERKALIISESILYKNEKLALLEEKDWKQIYSILCDGLINTCKKISRSSTFTNKEKSYVLWTIWYMIDWIDKNSNSEKITKHNKISDIIRKIWITYDKTSARGRAGGYGEMYINLWKIHTSKNADELLNVVTHELWHLFDTRSIEGAKPEKTSKTYTEWWRVRFYENDLSLEIYKAWFINENTPRDDAFLASQYAKTNIFESFAELANLYIHHNAIANYIASKDPTFAEAYNTMHTLFEWEYLSKDTENLTKLLTFEDPINTWGKVYDSTRIGRMLEYLEAVEKWFPTQSATDLYTW